MNWSLPLTQTVQFLCTEILHSKFTHGIVSMVNGEKDMYSHFFFTLHHTSSSSILISYSISALTNTKCLQHIVFQTLVVHSQTDPFNAII